ncbi:serine-rich repeat protein, putative, partial [Schistosoma mansoni]|uniref:serine-rich repeat protein, putative n=1 Tax=Schistosoma mansoni TaxID=6183 RepID=UPI00022C8165
DPDEQQHINNDCVPVDFDDGDHRQVPLTDLRILPDYFTNLCELINITGENNINCLTPCLISSDYLSLRHDSNINNNNGKDNGKFVSRIRRHSDLDHNTSRSYHSWSQSTSPLHDTMSLCSPRMNTNLMLDSKFFFTEKNSNKLTHRIKSNRTRKDSQLSSSSSNRTMECTVNSLISPTHTTSTGATSVMSLRSLSPLPSLQTPVIYPLNNHLSEEFTADNISISSTIATTDSSNECLSWQVYEKFKRRKQGCTYCRSIIRDVDGLIVKVGDCVQFGSGRNEIYLGEVKEIRWEQKRNSIIVVAAWYYQPLEAGKDGQLVQDIKGALFTTEHKDENEAKCIKRRIKIAKSYGQFIQGYYEKLKGKDPLESNQTQSDKNMGELTPNKDTEQINLEIRESLTSSSLASTSHSIKYPSVNENDTNQPPKLQITPNNNDNNNEISSDDNEEDDDVDDDNNSNFYHYFIAGKYDPVRQQVLTWDTELAKILNLKTHKNR